MQQYIGTKAAERLSKDLNTKVQIKKAAFSLFNSLDLEGVFIQDLKKDTLLYARSIQVKITDWFFLKSKTDLTYVALKDFVINMNRTTDSIWNYQFIVDKYSSTDTSKKVKDTSTALPKKTFAFKNIVLENGRFNMVDKWYGQDQIISLVRVAITPEQIDTRLKIAHLKSIDLQHVNYKNHAYQRLKPPSPKKIDTSGPGKYWKLFGWDVMATDIVMKNCTVASEVATVRAPYKHFDGQHLYFSNINANLKKLKWNTDTVTFALQLSAKERCGFEVKELKSNIVAYPNTINFSNLNIVTYNSNIKNKLSFSFDDFNKDIGLFVDNFIINANFKQSKIGVNDIAFFAPVVKNFIPNDIFIDGKVNGTVANFTANNIDIATGSSKLTGNLTMNGLPNAAKTYINFTNGSLQTNYTELTNFAPALKKINTVNLKALGNIDFNGNFSGFFNDFVTFGKIKTDLGTIDADINLKLPSDNTIPSYSGKLLTDGFNLGKLTKNTSLGKIGFNGKIEGKGFALDNIEAAINGTTTQFQYNGYTYENITTNGILNKKSYKGTIDVNDKNLVANLNGYLNFDTPQPIINATGNIEKSDFKKLQFLDKNLSFKGKFDVNVTGKSLDNFSGNVNLTDATFKNDEEILPFSYLNVNNTKTVDGNYLTFNSNEFEGYLNGKFSYNNVASAFSLFLHNYYPDVFAKPKQFSLNQKFDFDLKTKNIEPYLKIFAKDLVGLNNATLKGAIDTYSNTASFEGNIPYLAYGDYKFTDLDVIGNGTTDSLVTSLNILNFSIKDSLIFEQSKFKFQTRQNETNFLLSSNSQSSLNKVDINGKITLYDDGIQINFEPSSFTVNNKEWNLEKNGELILRKNLVFANDIKFKHSDEEILVKSLPDPDGVSTNLVAELKSIEINDFMPLLVKSNTFYGKLNGTVTVIDPTGNAKIEADASINNFVKDNEAIGTLQIKGDFDAKKVEANYNVKSQNLNYIFDLVGSYKENDSVGPPISNKITLNGTNVSVIQQYLKTVFDSTSGKAFGELEIFGSKEKQFIIGAVRVDTFSTKVKFTNVNYYAYNPIINFNINDIDFTGITLYDSKKRSAKVVSGKIEHDGFFGNMGLNIDLLTDQIEVLNTNRKLNSTFYGTAVSDAKLSIKGKIAEKLKMNLVVNNPTDANIVFNTSSTSRTMGKADFVEFKQYGREMTGDKSDINSSLDFNMRLKANQSAKITVVLDEETSDQITANGDGDLTINIANDGIKMLGNYVVNDGTYYFARQALLAKNFALTKGSTINWTGDPTNADINIKATYRAKNIALGDLAGNSSVTNFSTLESDLLVIADLTEKLSKPKITFDIKLPDDETKDPEIINALTLIGRDQSQLTKQVAFLVIFNRLLPPDQYQVKFNILGNSVNTLGGIIAGEANNVINGLLQKVFNSSSIKTTLDFRTYSLGGIGNTSDFERAIGSLGVSTDLVKNRVTVFVSGNVDFSLLNKTSNQNNFQLLPNLLLEYKILPNGTLVATFFHRQNLDLLATSNTSSSRRKSSGAGIAWRKESDNFKELFKRKRKTPKK